MKKVTVLLPKRKKTCVFRLTNNYIENVNAQIFASADHECHSQQSVRVTVIALDIPDPVLTQQH